jgi:hypothetical protein
MQEYWMVLCRHNTESPVTVNARLGIGERVVGWSYSGGRSCLNSVSAFSLFVDIAPHWAAVSHGFSDMTPHQNLYRYRIPLRRARAFTHRRLVPRSQRLVFRRHGIAVDMVSAVYLAYIRGQKSLISNFSRGGCFEVGYASSCFAAYLHMYSGIQTNKQGLACRLASCCCMSDMDTATERVNGVNSICVSRTSG